MALADSMYAQVSQRDKSRLHPSDIVESATKLAWYTDGLTAEEKQMISVALRAYFTISSVPELTDPVSAVSRSLAQSSFAYIRTGPSRIVPVLVVSLQDRPDVLGSTVTNVFERLLPKMEDFVVGGSSMETAPPYLIIVVATELQTCYSQPTFRTAFLHPDCVGETALAHEVSHIYFGTDYPDWFAEGVANFIAAYLTNQLDEFRTASRAEVGAAKLDFDGRNLGQVSRRQQALLGFLLLGDLHHGVLGDDGMRSFLQGARGRNLSGRSIEELAIVGAGAGREAAVRDIFNVYVR